MITTTMEVGCSLAEESAIRSAALLGGPQPLKAFLDDGRVLPVVVGVHLNVRSADVHLIASSLDAVIMGLLAIVPTVRVPVRAVVTGGVPHEAVL
jgi:hypothetical protein